MYDRNKRRELQKEEEEGSMHLTVVTGCLTGFLSANTLHSANSHPFLPSSRLAKLV